MPIWNASSRQRSKLLYDLEAGMPFLHRSAGSARDWLRQRLPRRTNYGSSFQFRGRGRGQMKLRGAYPLFATIAVLGVIAAHVGIAHTTAPSSDDVVNSGETAPVRTAAPTVVDYAGAADFFIVAPSAVSRNANYVAPVTVRTPQQSKEPERPSITLIGTILGSQREHRDFPQSGDAEHRSAATGGGS
jgi:hypothetical protein